MAPSRKALYNLLRLAQADGLDLPGLQGWELEDYSALPLDDLFSRLKMLGISIDEKSLQAFVESAKSPEELTELLAPDEAGDEVYDQVYLLVFELWRRLFPDRRPHSIFCNELDDLMTAWYAEEEDSTEPARAALHLLQSVLQDADAGGLEPETIFAMISEGCGNNLAGFLYDFGRSQLEEEDGDPDEARQIYSFYRGLLPDPRWMDLLHAAQLDAEGQEEESATLYLKLAGQLAENWSLQLALELITDLLGSEEIVTALQLIELGLHRAQCNQEAADLLEPIIVLVNEIQADQLSRVLMNAWETLVVEPLARFAPEDREPLLAMLQLLRQELEQAEE